MAVEGTMEGGEAAAPPPPPTGIAAFIQSPLGRNILLASGIAASIAVIVAVWLWTQKPEYKVLFSNMSDRDSGAVIAQLNTLNVPYKFAEGGGAILVPSDLVYDTRVKLAAQGLPKGGNVGFEIMENQKLGISQFLEQVNYQRALEGELANSIQSVQGVQSARVHLALPKSSVFVRDQQKPTASVLLNLMPGRVLDEQQVSAIVHLVASSVPELTARNVTIVDQNGDLLSSADKMPNPNGLDPSQLKYVQELQENISKRVEAIISPIVGQNNVRAEASAEVDFSHSEQAAETYGPNQPPNQAAVRSQQSSEGSSSSPNGPAGVPGALTNQPPVPATAPIAAPPATTTATTATTPGNSHKDSTVNYEVDKTVRYTQQPMGGLKRLSVAVVVNYKREVDKNGKVAMKPMTEDEKTQITNLVKEAMGYNKDRGDTLSVANSSFAGAEEEVPFWKRPEFQMELAKEVAKWLAFGLFALWVYLSFIRPMLKRLKKNIEPEEPVVEETEEAEGEGLEDEDAIVHLSEEPEPMGKSPKAYQNNLDAARTLAKEDPKVVANIIKGWAGVTE